MRFPSPLIKGTLIKKYRRFIVDVRLEDGTTVTAHCPTMGIMNGLSEPGSVVMLSDSGLETRRHKLTWELIEVNGMWVGVNSATPRKVLVESIEQGLIPTFKGFDAPQVDVKYGHGNTIDVMLQGMEHNCFIDTFHVSWVEQDVALFPDVAAPRMTKSIHQLTEIAQQGHRAAAFFFVQRRGLFGVQACRRDRQGLPQGNARRQKRRSGHHSVPRQRFGTRGHSRHANPLFHGLT